MPAYDKPLPEPTRDSQPHWDGLRAHKLVVQRCRHCNRLRHYPRPVCAHCYSMDCDWIEVSGRGRIHSWTVTHHAFHFAFKRELPYVSVLVDLDAGVRMQAPLVDGVNAKLALELPVAIVFEDVTPDLTLPRFRLLT